MSRKLSRNLSQTQVQVRRERFMPFRSLNTAVEMRTVHAAVDGVDLLEDAESETELRLDGQPWSHLDLHFELAVESDVIDQVLPEHERATPPLRWALVLEAPRTRIRRVVTAAWEGPKFTARFELSARDIAGPVTITPWLVRSESSESRSENGNATIGYASAEGHRLASGRVFTLYTDPVPVRSGKFLDVRYKAFSQDVALRSGFLYHLDTIGEPVLWINSDHASIAEVLNAKGQSGIRARLRELFFDTISGAVWTQLFLRSASALSEASLGDGMEVRKPWQSGVLRELLPYMFPKKTSHDERLRELLAVREESLGLLAELCDSALQQRGDVVKHMSRLIERADAGASS